MRLITLLLLALVATPQHLPSIKRVHISQLSGGQQADQIRDMLIASFHRAGLFALTEDPDRADAILKGSAEDVAFTDTFDTTDGITARSATNLGSLGAGANTRRNGSSNVSVADRESSKIQERKHEASASVRLVNKEGDIIWSTTQESLGAKFRSSSADVAEKITKQLIADWKKASDSPKPSDANPLPR